MNDHSGAAAAWTPTNSRRLRVALVRLHRWLGLSLGILLVVIGLTGSFVVFYREIDAALNPSLYIPAGPQHRLKAAEVMRIAAIADQAPIRSVIAPDRTWPVWIVMHSHATEKGQYPNLWTTMIDPSNGRVLGRRDYTNCFAFTVYRMHHNLLLYDWWGHELVGAIGFLLLGMACSGLYLWWRERARFWRSVSIRRHVSAQRLMRDLHNTAGFWSLPLLALIAVTGIGIVFPSVIRPLVGLVSTADPDPSPIIKSSLSNEATRLSADAMVLAARTAKPGYEIAQLTPPNERRNTWRILLRPPGSDPALRTRGAIWLDPWTGALTHDRTPDSMSLGDRYMTGQLWLHNGSAFGLLGRLLVFATGFVPLILFVTSFQIWRWRRAAKNRTCAIV
ncbi:putative iron-regulated membrane protein [Nitrobacter vulgaris]|uniref:PepSY-associated TM helix domain-containing protein n=1 Tax=Nitrobacter vulgaris TaxID=29421 RepID=UPI00285A382C|nr:PepSY-associated TM helix domain-containing protein [Nitrobacter vulgaris]MDR6306319.1 putative iron-regulated membrane protein [Nitrobacter vulgaris]